MKRLAIILSALLILGGIMSEPASAAGRVNLNQVLNSTPKHLQFFNSTSPEILFYGGAGAGKSYTIADKLFLQGILKPTERQKIVVVRKTLSSLRKSTLDITERWPASLHRPSLPDRRRRCAGLIAQGLAPVATAHRTRDRAWTGRRPATRHGARGH